MIILVASKSALPDIVSRLRPYLENVAINAALPLEASRSSDGNVTFWSVYLSESVQPVSSNPARQRPRSASSLDFIVPRIRTKFGDRAFSDAGPTVWNSLPESVRSADTLASFKRKLKTYLFNISF